LLSSQTTTEIVQLILSEGHLPAAALAWDLDEAWFGAGSYGAREGFAVAHSQLNSGNATQGRVVFSLASLAG
jgi:hypothetical protein